MDTSHTAIFDADLVGRYDLLGPRYTSYPTAPQFHARFGATDFAAAAQRSNQALDPSDLSLYVHVPFCASPCFYCGCHRVITRDRSRAERYLDLLEREIALAAPLFARGRRVLQLHLGGGTPNFLDLAQMARLVDVLQRHFSLCDGSEREFSVELDARHADPDYVRGLAALGFNRFSLGIQDFDPAVQRAVNRLQSVEQTAAAIAAARASGCQSVSVDLIYGLPEQNLAGFARTLDTVIALRPDRVAAYSYAHLPQMFKAQRQIDAAALPDGAAKLALLGLCVDKLGAAGYRYVGMDHFALPGDELVRAQEQGTLQRNFQGYSTHGQCDLIGLGVSAISRIGNVYSQNVKDLPLYEARLGQGQLPLWRGLALSDDDRVRHDAIMQLMCHGELDTARFGAEHRLDFDVYFAAERARLAELARDGLVRLEPQRIQVTPRGRYLLRVVAMSFDAYRTPAAPATQYSRVI
jgi:oxygen-independent coproporphyrinogen-3 oxidase